MIDIGVCFRYAIGDWDGPEEAFEIRLVLQLLKHYSDI